MPMMTFTTTKRIYPKLFIDGTLEHFEEKGTAITINLKGNGGIMGSQEKLIGFLVGLNLVCTCFNILAIILKIH